MHASPIRSDTLRELRRQLLKSVTAGVTQQTVPTGLADLDALLPGGGFPTASVLEWVSLHPGLSAASVALHCIPAFLKLPGCLAVVDPRHEFCAAAAETAGVPLSRLLLIRPVEAAEQTGTAHLSQTAGRPAVQAVDRRLPRYGPRRSLRQSETLWSLEQAARCPGVRVVLCWLDRVPSTVLRRLQLAVEHSGVSVFLIRPAAVLQQPSWADYRLQVGLAEPHELAVQRQQLPVPAPRVLSVRLLRSRQTLQHSGPALLKMDHETGVVRTFSELADSATAAAVAAG